MMTDPTPDALLPVEQCDRDAAAALQHDYTARRMRAGGIDDSPFIQAFARHRIEARRAAPSGSDGGQDRNFAFRDGRFVNRMSGEPIPADEPIIIFRARDNHALHILREYLSLASDPHHRQAIKDRMAEFDAYRAAHPDRVKEPGITHAIRLNEPEPEPMSLDTLATSKAKLSIAVVRARNSGQDRVGVDPSDVAVLLAAHSDLDRRLSTPSEPGLGQSVGKLLDRIIFGAPSEPAASVGREELLLIVGRGYTTEWKTREGDGFQIVWAGEEQRVFFAGEDDAYDALCKMRTDAILAALQSPPAAKVEDAGEEFNRGVLIAVATLINVWGGGTETEHLLRMIDADVAMVERMDFTDYDREPLIAALAARGPQS